MSSFKFAISGGTGWLGRELIHMLIEEQMINNLSEVCVFSSKMVDLDFQECGKIQTRPFLENDFREIDDVDCFVHLAFLTRDLIAKYTLPNFIHINEKLTNQALTFIEVVRPHSVANVSSGAVISRTKKDLENDIRGNPYGFLKLEEERKLAEICTRFAIRLSIGRLWGATGKRMPLNRAYAVSDFIYQAISAHEIVVRSDYLVWRRYCDAAEFMHILLLAAENFKYTLFDSGGPKVEIGNLAELIANHVGKEVRVSRNLKRNDFVDDYFPLSSKYEELASSANKSLSGLSSQVTRTIEGHIVQFAKNSLR